MNVTLKKQLLILFLEASGLAKKFDFFIIGAQKCGTTSLFDFMNQHPSCVGAGGKETLLFSSTGYKKVGVKETLSSFVAKDLLKNNRNRLFFEATPDYVYLEEVPGRLYQYNPEACLIFLVREPVSRAISEYNMACRYAVEDNLCVREDPCHEYFDFLKNPEKYPFSWFIEEEFRRIKETGSYLPSAFHFPDFIRHGLYADQLKRYYHYFKPEQILIIEDKELRNHRVETLYLIENFLGIPHYNWKEDKLVNSNVGVYNQQISADCKEFLKSFFKPWNERFFHMIGRRMDW